ncbi:MAG: aldose 1-epimerase family protein, partial [Clostridia bacterium]|nr:aldose 1-epimerase family protein [Clostridia bacterium]
PILFPIVGELHEQTFLYEGKEYHLPRHGFARKMTFDFVGEGDNFVEFSLKSDEETLEIYPFDFELVVRYALNKNNLSVSHTVINKTDGDMYFSLGAHPGFNCEIGDSLYFSEIENLETERVEAEGTRIDEKFPALDNTNEILITNEIFETDALILSGFKSKSITLKSPNHSREVRFDLGNAPYLGIWSKPGAPYVCIEPWHGVCDTIHGNEDFTKKQAIEHLNKGEKFNFTWSAEII